MSNVKKHTLPTLIILFILLFSVFIMLLPSFSSKGVSRMEMNKSMELPYILDANKDIELIFFGYAGCIAICTPRLESLSAWYTHLENKNKIGVRFMDISAPKDRELPMAFAQAFNKDFIGVHLAQSQIREYTRPFQVYFSTSLIDSTEFDHTANLYLLKREGQKKVLRYIYTSYPFDFEQINLDIKELLNE